MCGWKVSLREIGNPIRNFGFLVRGNGVPIREDGVPMRVSGIALQGAGIPLREKRWTFRGGQKKRYTIQRCAVSGNGLQVRKKGYPTQRTVPRFGLLGVTLSRSMLCRSCVGSLSELCRSCGELRTCVGPVSFLERLFQTCVGSVSDMDEAVADLWQNCGDGAVSGSVAELCRSCGGAVVGLCRSCVGSVS
eukprot:gene15096-biopygen21692